MPTHKRLSLAEIAKQDQNSSPPHREPSLHAVDAEHPQKPSFSEKRNRKSDFIKISVTLPPDMHEALQEISHARRKGKERHMITDFVREALANWLSEQKD